MKGAEHGLDVGVIVAELTFGGVAEVEGALRDAVVELPHRSIVGEGHAGMKLGGDMIKEVLAIAPNE